MMISPLADLRAQVEALEGRVSKNFRTDTESFRIRDDLYRAAMERMDGLAARIKALEEGR